MSGIFFYCECFHFDINFLILFSDDEPAAIHHKNTTSGNGGTSSTKEDGKTPKALPTPVAVPASEIVSLYKSKKKNYREDQKASEVAAAGGLQEAQKDNHLILVAVSYVVATYFHMTKNAKVDSIIAR